MKKIVIIGGGTGNFVTLTGMKKYDVDLTAIVSMADDGGSTGILRDDLGVLPPGDVRQCLVALSNSSRLMRSLMNYRFENGNLGGHSFGNLLLSALEKVTGSFEHAVEEAGRILYIRGKVLPVTTNKVRLQMLLERGKKLEGEKQVYLSKEIDKGYKDISLVPSPQVNPLVIDSIRNCDLVVISPGGLHTSIIPNLLVEGVSEAICKTQAKKVFVVNLLNRIGQTTDYKVSDYINEVSKYLGKDVFDYIFVNSKSPPEKLMKLYADQGQLIENDLKDDPRVVSADFLGSFAEKAKTDLIERSLIRHDSDKLAMELMKVVHHL